MKKLLSIMLVLAMLVPTAAFAEDGEISVLLDGKRIGFDVQPIIENERTLVPMRAIFEALGAEIDWNESNQTVMATRTDAVVFITIGSEKMTLHTANDDAKSIELDAPARIVDNRTLVPLRAVSEAFDCDVQWDGDTRTVTIARQYKILKGRLKMSEKNGWDVVDYSYNNTDSMWIELSKDGSYINMTVFELGCMSAGSLKEDISNLGYELIGNITAQNGIELACIADKTSDTAYEMGYIVKSADGYLLSIDFNSGLKGVSVGDVDKEVKSVMDSMSAGELKLNTSARTVRLDDLTIKLPEGYFASPKYTYDIDEWEIKKIAPSDVKNVPFISIHYGYEPSYDKLYKGEKPYKTVKSKFVGHDIVWNLYKKDNYMQAFYEDGGMYYHLYSGAENAEQQQEFIDLVSTIKGSVPAAAAKPVIYLYPECEQEVSVRLDLDGEFTFTYPEYKNGWEVTAKPDGTIISDGKEYSYLFWEGEMPDFKSEFKEGFVVKGSDSAEFLRETLSKMGLTPREYNEFIVYWAPKMQENEYNKIYFAQEEYEQAAKLNITPKPDSVLRVFMVYEPAAADTVLPKQEIQPFERKGFTVVEWGGLLK